MKDRRREEIERLYNSALERKPEARAAYLHEACGDDSLGKEVESLLARQSEAEGFMESPALEIAAKAMAEDLKKGPTSDLVGRSLSHYRILQKIGEGGMGVIYRAYDEHLQRDVAIKVLTPGTLGDESVRKRFRKEALALSKLSHPNIETVHDFDTQTHRKFKLQVSMMGIRLRGVAQFLIRGVMLTSARLLQLPRAQG